VSGNALPGDLSAFLDPLEASLSAFSRAYMLEQWALYTGGRADGLPHLQRVRAEIYRDLATREGIDRWRGQCAGPSIERRRLDLHQLAFRAALVDAEEPIVALEASLCEMHSCHRAWLDGRSRDDQELLYVLTHDRDRSRREHAWRARNALAVEMAPGLSQLVDRRNAAAERHGATSFHAFKLGLSGLCEEELLRSALLLEEATREPLVGWLDERRARLGVPRLEPWDLSFDVSGLKGRLRPYFGASALMPTLARALAGLGFVLDRLPILLDTEDRPHRSPHAYSFAIDAPRDVRVLCHIAAGAASWQTVFHELGHAVYSTHHDEELPWSLRDAPAACFHEAIAQLFGGLVYDPDFLRRYLKLPEELLAEVEREHRMERIVELRWRLAMLHFERALYADRDGAPAASWWTQVDRYVGGGRLGLHVDVPSFARILHFSTHPVYVQNYLVADLIAAQLRRALCADVGGFVDRPLAGRWLVDKVFRHGATLEWEALLTQATGEPLGPRYDGEALGLQAGWR
jgi:peptidyl-dipeptidase A